MAFNSKPHFEGKQPADNDKMLTNQDISGQESLQTLKKQLAEEIHQLQLLKLNIKKVKSEITYFKNIEQEISQLLLNAHLSAAEQVFMAMLEARQAERTATDQVLHKKNELTKLSTSITEAKDKTGAATGGYQVESVLPEGVFPDESDHS